MLGTRKLDSLLFCEKIHLMALSCLILKFDFIVHVNLKLWIIGNVSEANGSPLFVFVFVSDDIYNFLFLISNLAKLITFKF